MWAWGDVGSGSSGGDGRRLGHGPFSTAECGLASGVASGGGDFFAEEFGQHEERERHGPGEAGGVVGGALERGEHLGLGFAGELFVEQAFLQSFEVAGFGGAKIRRGRDGPGEPGFGSGAVRQPPFVVGCRFHRSIHNRYRTFFPNGEGPFREVLGSSAKAH